jgi:carboxymethylenebutenolidase
MPTSEAASRREGNPISSFAPHAELAEDRTSSCPLARGYSWPMRMLLASASTNQEGNMEHKIVIQSPAGKFQAYISRPSKLPAPAIVVLQELFGVNADIRAHCDELAAQGFIGIAPDLFWRQEPGVDLTVRSEADWQHGLRLYAAYDRDAGVKDILETVRTAVELPESTGKVALQGYCLGALMAFITAARHEVDAAVAYHGGDTEKYLGDVGGLHAPLLMHLGEEDEFISKTAQAQIKAALAGKPNATVYSYPGQCHAFSRHNGAHYNAAAATLADGRTTEFLHQHLR